MKKKLIAAVVTALVIGLVLGVLLGVLYMSSRSRSANAPEITPSFTPEPTPVPTPTPSPEPTPDPEEIALDDLRKRQAEESDFLTLVNPWNQVPLDYEPQVESYWVDWIYDIELDVRCLEPLMNMYHDCQAAGGQPFITSAYRTYWTQYDLFQNKIIRCIEEDNVSEEDAPTVAAESVAVPGTSEHELGLTFDIIDLEYTELDEGQEQTFTQQWLMEHCWEYGFILRYPNGTSDITGIIYEPWHYRYVGLVAAQAIHERGITLEEYLQLLDPDRVIAGPDNADRIGLDETYTARKAAQWNGESDYYEETYEEDSESYGEADNVYYEDWE